MSDEFDVRRKELHDLNIRAWQGEEGLFKTKIKLDTSLKKNTAFIKKLRVGITKESEKSLIDGIQSTSLEKYMVEMSSAICESLCKVSKNQDIQSAIEVVSALHQRFGSKFTPFIELYFVHFIVAPKEILTEKDDKERLTRIKNLLGLTMEFYMCGIFRTLLDMPEEELPNYLLKLKNKNKGDVAIIVPVVKEIMSYEFNNGATLALAGSFLKKFSKYFLEDSEICEETCKLYLKKLFESYTESAVSLTENYFKGMKKTVLKSKSISMKTGKIFEDLEQKTEELKGLFEKFKSYCDIACPLLKIKFPVLEEEEKEKENSVTVTVSNSSKQQNSIWENEESRKFYTEIPELSNLVSSVYLDEVDNSSFDDLNSKGIKMTEVLLKLDEASSAKEVDGTIIQFWEYGLNNKASKQRMYKHFIETREVHKFKNIARFLKINEIYFSKCIDDIIDRLDKSFRFQIHHDSITEKDIMVFSELVKFKMVPIHVLFHKVRTLILSIDICNNIDLLSLLFDGCGKMLLNDPEYKENTDELIQLLKNLKSTRHFSHTDAQAVRIFLLSLNPPSVKKVTPTIELTNDENFLLQLTRKELNSSNWKTVSNNFKCMDWANKITYKRIEMILSKPEDISYVNLTFLSKIFYDLTKDENISLRVRVIDQIFEDIIVGLEENDYNQNRKRLAKCKYLIEITNLKMLELSSVIKLLYCIICFGHKGNNPSRGEICELDLADDYFRIRMICIMLNTLSISFLNKRTKREILTFYRFFDYYIGTKVLPLPFEIDNKVGELVRHLNKVIGGTEIKRAGNFIEAVKNLQEAMVEQGLKEEEQEDEEAEVEIEIEEDEVNSDDSLQDSELEDSDEDLEDGSDEEEDEDDEDSELEDSEDSEDELEDSEEEGEIELESDDETDDDKDERFSKEMDEKFNAEMDNEFNKLVRESLNIRSTLNNKQTSLSDKMGNPTAILSKVGNDGLNSVADGHKFTFLSRSGKKMQTRDIELPEDTKFTANFTKGLEKAKKEKETIKTIVLNSLQSM